MQRFVAASLVLLLGLSTGVAAEGDPAELRATMGEIFESIRVLLPLSASSQRFAEAAPVRPALRSLAEHADSLARHGSDPRFRHLGNTLARDARDALWTHERGQPEQARFLIHQLTESCISCHARLPAGDSPRATDWLDDAALRALPLAERAGLQMATRRFDDALASYESLLSTRAYAPASLLSPLTDYLILTVRVKQKPERAIPTLERFARRPDLWRHLKIDVEHWIRGLGEIAGSLKQAPSLARARALLETARSEIRFPADRRGLVHYVAASSQLHRLVEADAGSPEERAEAYYLLGLVESRIGRNEWVSQSGALLEAAIRLAPKAPFAETAYAILEEETVSDYGGLDGEALPADVARNLAELRDLLDR